jgi:KEOPS complex subunit Pcc1
VPADPDRDPASGDASDDDAPHRLDLAFDYPDEPTARLVHDSVALEVGRIEGDRTRVLLDREGATVRLSVTADDPVALRAGLNTWCTLVGVAERVIGTDAR